MKIIYIYTHTHSSCSGEVQRFELKKYTACTAVLQGRGNCRRASGPRQHVAGTRSGVALAGLLHAGYLYTGMLPVEKRERWHECLGGTNERD